VSLELKRNTSKRRFKMQEHHRANQEANMADNRRQEENELSDQALDEVSGGITPIPIPGADLSKYLQKSINPLINPVLNPKGFEGGGGIE
jgi:hypothetical protein